MTETMKPDMHLDLNLLAAMGEGAVSGAERDTLLSHLAECDVCRRIAFLAQVSNSDGVKEKRFAIFNFAPFTAVAASIACVIAFALSSVFRVEKTPPHPARSAGANVDMGLYCRSGERPVTAESRRVSSSSRVLPRVLPRVISKPSPATDWIRPVKPSTQRLVVLPEPLLPAPVIRLTMEIGLKFGHEAPESMLHGVALPKQDLPLRPLPSVSFGSAPGRDWAPLYQKATFQQLAVSNFDLPIRQPFATRWPHD